jgi:hypothetical protein
MHPGMLGMNPLIITGGTASFCITSIVVFIEPDWYEIEYDKGATGQ